MHVYRLLSRSKKNLDVSYVNRSTFWGNKFLCCGNRVLWTLPWLPLQVNSTQLNHLLWLIPIFSPSGLGHVPLFVLFPWSREDANRGNNSCWRGMLHLVPLREASCCHPRKTDEKHSVLGTLASSFFSQHTLPLMPLQMWWMGQDSAACSAFSHLGL